MIAYFNSCQLNKEQQYQHHIGIIQYVYCVHFALLLVPLRFGVVVAGNSKGLLQTRRKLCGSLNWSMGSHQISPLQ
jgi:hypothetical protein